MLRAPSAHQGRHPRVLASSIGIAALVVAIALPAGPAAATSRQPASPSTAAPSADGFGCDPGSTPTDAVPGSTGQLATNVRASALSDATTIERPIGIDVSHWNGNVPFGSIAASGVAFVIMKASQGTGFVDPRFAQNLAAARAAGLTVGAYHFFDYRKDGVMQARHYLGVLREQGALDDALPPAIDVECHEEMGPAERSKSRVRLRKLVDELYRQTGRRPTIYTSAHMWRHVIGGDTSFGLNRLWVACWRCDHPAMPIGWTRWTFWQNGRLRIPDVGAYDGNVSRGSLADLLRLRSRPMRIKVSSGLTADRTIALDLVGYDGTEVRYAVDGGEWGDWVAAERTGHLTLSAGDGSRSVAVQLRDERGNLGPVLRDSVLLDSTPPDVSARRPVLRVAALQFDGRPVPVRVSWSIADATSGVSSAEVALGCGGQRVAVFSLADVSERDGADDGSVPAGESCRVLASASDAAGNVTVADTSSWTTRLVPDSGNPSVIYSGPWAVKPVVGAAGGTLHYARTDRSRVWFTFQGTDIALISTLGPDRGRARVLLDGVPAGAVDLYARRRSTGHVVFAHRFLFGGSHTIEVVVSGKRNPSSEGQRVDIDGFVVMSVPTTN